MTNVISAIGSWIIGLVLGILRQKCSLDVQKNTALSNGDTWQQFVQLLVTTNDKMQATLIDPTLLRVTSSVTGHFQNVCRKVFHNSCYTAPTRSVQQHLPQSLCIRPTGHWRPALLEQDLEVCFTSLPLYRVLTLYNSYNWLANSILYYVFKNQKWRRFFMSQQKCYVMFMLGKIYYM